MNRKHPKNSSDSIVHTSAPIQVTVPSFCAHHRANRNKVNSSGPQDEILKKEEIGRHQKKRKSTACVARGQEEDASEER